MRKMGIPAPKRASTFLASPASPALHASGMSVLLRVFKLVLKYPWRAAASLAMAVVCTLLVLVLPTVTQVLVDDVIGKRRQDQLFQTAALGIGAIFIRQLLFTLRTYGDNALERRLVHDLRRQLYDKLQRLPIKWFDSNSSGEIMSRVAHGGHPCRLGHSEGCVEALEHYFGA